MALNPPIHFLPIRAANFVLSTNEVHIWRARLDVSNSRVEQFMDTLTTDELGRATRFRFLTDRNHFIVARGLLRVILAGYLGDKSDELRFWYNRFGKPALVQRNDRDIINFNLSHTSGRVIFAITKANMIGIDIERVRADFDCEEIADQYFTRGEKAAIHGLPQSEKHNTFFIYWTLKEAYSKANGVGLSLPLDQFDASVDQEGARINAEVEDRELRTGQSIC